MSTNQWTMFLLDYCKVLKIIHDTILNRKRSANLGEPQ